MAAIERLKKKNDPQVSIALLRMKPMKAMSTNQSENDMAEDTAEGEKDMPETPMAEAKSEMTEEKTSAGDLCDALQSLLDNVSAYYITAHQFHWNVVGPDFSEFHAFFEEIYKDAWKSLDTLAESMRKLGDMVDIKFGQPDKCEGVGEMLACLHEMNAALIMQYKDACEKADEADEQGILNLLADRLDHHQKYQWMLTSFGSR